VDGPGAACRDDRITVGEFVRLRWEVTHREPVIRSPRSSPIVADPTFLLPETTPDGR
jgi:hypothetical protein